MAQNWNNIVNFVKANLGTKHSSIELTDDFLNDTFYTNPADLVMANTFNDMNQFLKSVNDYQFIKPDYLRFSDEPSIDTFIVELNIEHSNLNTIPGDMYHKLFKQICLVDAYELVINNRNKYNNLTTPFGNIDLNIDYMTQRSQELRQKIDDIIDNLPHREYLEIF